MHGNGKYFPYFFNVLYFPLDSLTINSSFHSKRENYVLLTPNLNKRNIYKNTFLRVRYHLKLKIYCSSERVEVSFLSFSS